MKKLTAMAAALLVSLYTMAESGASGDIFSGNLKVYIPVAVLAIILGCIFAFLFSMEGRLKKLEGGK